MSSGSNEGQAYIELVSRSVVAEVAADELEFFDELAAEYHKDPSPPNVGDAELGSGLGAGLAAITPAAIAMVTAVVSNILGDEAVRKNTADFIKQGLRDILGSESLDKEPSTRLTQEQLVKIRKIAQAEAKRFGVDNETSKNMANALIGSIVMSLGT